MTGAGETLWCFTTVMEGDALLKKQIGYFDCKVVSYPGCRQAEDTIVTSGPFDMIAWPGNTTEDVQSSVQVVNRYLRE